MINLCACDKNSSTGNNSGGSDQNYNLQDENKNNLEDAIEQARMAASYFYFDNYGTDYCDEKACIKGNRSNEVWYKITDQRFNSLENAKKFLGEHFSEELVDQIIAQALRNEYLILKKGGNEIYTLIN